MELGLIRKLSDIHEAQEVSFQLVHLVYDVGVQRKNLEEQKDRITVQEQLKCAATRADRSLEGW